MPLYLTKKNKLIFFSTQVLLLFYFLGCSGPAKDLSSNPNVVQAQERNRGPDRQIPGTNPLELLKLEQVQQELGLTTEQIEQLKQANAEIESKLANSAPNPPSIQGKQADQAREKIAQILSQEQLNRFKQIAFQVHGWGIMSEDELKEILVITPEQYQQLKVFYEQNRQKLSNSLQIPKNNDPKECQKVLVNNYQKLIESSQENNQKLVSILAADQVQTLAYMQGEKFDLNLDKIPAICP